MRWGTALLTLVGAVALLAGCGGGGGGSGGGGAKPLAKADYVRQMAAIGKGLSTSLNALSSATTAKTAATELAQAQVALRAAVKKLDAIVPPSDITVQHGKLAAAVGEFADELDPVIAKLKKGNMSALAGVTSLKGLTGIRTASSAITKAGYKIGG
jgi:hypothetical protein